MTSSTSNTDKMPTFPNCATTTSAAGSNSLFSRELTTKSQINADEQSYLTVQLSMQAMSCMLDIMVTVSRIGAQIVFVSAKENAAILSLKAKPFIIRRVPLLLKELVQVLDVKIV